MYVLNKAVVFQQLVPFYFASNQAFYLGHCGKHLKLKLSVTDWLNCPLSLWIGISKFVYFADSGRTGL